MSVRLTEGEAWERLAAAHTGVFTTLRRDGRPVPLPVWFVVLGRRAYLRTPAGSAKVRRLRHDDRASLLVESGIRWTELTAVLVQGRAFPVEDEGEQAVAQAALTDKYAGYGPPVGRLPAATREHYGQAMAVIRFEPTEPCVTWDNSRLNLSGDRD
ncbi:PPOX class probable F420-dependent enzyme, Rv2061 family [Thermomonospora echinospora]|uniref:PPOX class probable F420-dependent enzyme, Rv2061 family n=1 Tax=Thermomonospora echinospora TaxID=1992 RepID=A0A1H6DTN9_9ACTN|nr:pyridoxamine 5'-phosphate oxidase family protein [Thermomonospora echinospora]SEG88599.1 PPOX class probable F420-dependent enzyme, Rv2061 family [Thermomonospora echinospora]